VLLVGGDRHHRLRRCAEQQIVDNGLVLEGDLGDLRRRVKTTWKYPTGSRSASRSASHVRAAAPWHLGQCRLRQLLYAIRR